jgi:hypothetical protein
MSVPRIDDGLDAFDVLDEPGTPDDGPLSPERAIATYRAALQGGADWYHALLHVISRWVAPEEFVDDTHLRYLIAGEAFDWLLLAQRLVTAAEDLLPAEGVEQLIVHGIPPHLQDEEEFEAALGPAKYRAHLNFQYGVVVEELLLLSAELELSKAGTLARHGQPGADVQAFERVYGKPLDELRILYNADHGYIGDEMSQSEMREFIYWLSKYRIRWAEPARIASDTRKAMTMLARLEASRTRAARLRMAEERRANPPIDAR